MSFLMIITTTGTDERFTSNIIQYTILMISSSGLGSELVIYPSNILFYSILFGSLFS